jgi:hypothetical protein
MRTPLRSRRGPANMVGPSPRRAASSDVVTAGGRDLANRRDVVDKSPWWRHLSPASATIGVGRVPRRVERVPGNGQEPAS